MNRQLAIVASIGLVATAGCFRQAPEIVDTGLAGPLIVEMNPSGRVPLTGIARFTTVDPARSTITVTDDAGHSFAATSGEAPATQHEITLLGFRPDRAHVLTLTLERADGSTTEAASVTLRTPELPWETPPIEVRLAQTDRLEPGLTLVPLFRWFGPEIDLNYSQMFAMDAEGEIVWLYEAPHSFYEVKLLENGNLLYLQENWTATEIDWLGNEVANWHPGRTQRNAPSDSIAVDVDSFHHDIVEMPSGNFLSLSTEVREIEDWYTSEIDPDAARETTNVVGDILFEMQRDGTVVNEWKFFDLIDAYRIGYGSTGTDFYVGLYDGILEEPGADWTHNNGIYYDAATNTALVSTNHLSTVMNLDLASGELLWMLGDPGGWREPWSDLLLEPEDENMIRSYHHHAPRWTPAGTLLLYDNGAQRARPPDPPVPLEENFSRAVEYAIDGDARTVREVWSYGGPGSERFISAFISEADWLPQTENILLTNGGRARDREGNDTEDFLTGHLWVQLFEVTHEMPAEKLWEAVIDDPRWGWTAFRTERIPKLNPKGR